jgi:hypothetical protein
MGEEPFLFSANGHSNVEQTFLPVILELKSRARQECLTRIEKTNPGLLAPADTAGHLPRIQDGQKITDRTLRNLLQPLRFGVAASFSHQVLPPLFPCSSRHSRHLPWKSQPVLGQEQSLPS